MSTKKSSSKPKPAALRVGDRVWVSFAGRRRIARIIEDRGRIGIGGRRLLRVVYAAAGGQFQESFEIPAADVTPAKPSAAAPRTTKAKAAHV